MLEDHSGGEKHLTIRDEAAPKAQALFNMVVLRATRCSSEEDYHILEMSNPYEKTAER